MVDLGHARLGAFIKMKANLPVNLMASLGGVRDTPPIRVPTQEFRGLHLPTTVPCRKKIHGANCNAFDTN